MRLKEFAPIQERSSTERQARFMAAAAHDPKFAKRVGIQHSVAQEFNRKDTGTQLLSRAMKHRNDNAKENYVSNRDQGAGSERPQDQRLLEKPRMVKPRERELKDHIGMTIGTSSGGGAWANSGAKFKQM